MPEDPYVAPVERLLRDSRRRELEPGQPRVAVENALWVCACGSEDPETDAPTWLVYDRADDGTVEWCRVPERAEPLDLVEARLTAGNHSSAMEVLAWLERTADDPWSGWDVQSGDAVVLTTLREKILAD